MPSTTFSQKCIAFGLIHLTHFWQCTTFFASCGVNFAPGNWTQAKPVSNENSTCPKLTQQLAKKVVHCHKWVRWISPKSMHFCENVVDGMDGYKSRCLDQLTRYLTSNILYGRGSAHTTPITYIYNSLLQSFKTNTNLFFYKHMCVHSYVLLTSFWSLSYLGTTWKFYLSYNE